MGSRPWGFDSLLGHHAGPVLRAPRGALSCGDLRGTIPAMLKLIILVILFFFDIFGFVSNDMRIDGVFVKIVVNSAGVGLKGDWSVGKSG